MLPQGPWTMSPRVGCTAILDAHGQPITFIDTFPRSYQGEPCGSITSQGRSCTELASITRGIAALPRLLKTLHDLDRWAQENCDLLPVAFQTYADLIDAAIRAVDGD